MKKVFRWNTPDLDYILTEGDILYKSLGAMDLLLADELPRSVVMSDYNIPIDYLELETEIANLRTGEPFLRRIISIIAYGETMLLFMGGFTTAIMKQHVYFYLFDSHSRDEQSLSIVGGTSVLLKFSDLTEVEKYIQVFYLEYRSLEQSYFQLQFVRINIDRVLSSNILNHYQRFIRRPGYQEHFIKKLFDGGFINNSTNSHRKRKEYNPLVEPPKDTVKSKKKKREDASNYTQQEGKVVEEKVGSFKNLNSVRKFKSLIKNGPYFICVICHRGLYKRSVSKCSRSSCSSLTKQLLDLKRSYDGCFYICKTCHSKVKRNKIPCQPVSNKLSVEQLPSEFRNLERLETVLVARRILFKKITVMPKGQFPKVKGNICNIPIAEIESNCKSLPRPADSNGIIVVKLKRKNEFRGHVLFEPVRPRLIESILNYLKLSNHLYRDIKIAMENLPTGYPNLQIEGSEDNIYNYIIKNVTQPLEIIIENSVVEDLSQDRACSIDTDQSHCVTQCEKFSNENTRIPIDTTCESEIPLAEFQSPSLETTITTEIPTVDNIEQLIAIAPGKRKKPISILNDIYCEEMAHPHLYPTGKFGYKVKGDVPLTPSKYFKQRLLNYSQHFASDPDYIFFAHSVMQKIHLNDQISIAMRKITSNCLNAGMLSSNFIATVQQLIAQDKAYILCLQSKLHQRTGKNFYLKF